MAKAELINSTDGVSSATRFRSGSDVVSRRGVQKKIERQLEARRGAALLLDGPDWRDVHLELQGAIPRCVQRTYGVSYLTFECQLSCMSMAKLRGKRHWIRLTIRCSPWSFLPRTSMVRSHGLLQLAGIL